MSDTRGEAGGRRKSRIVINVAQAQAEAQAQRRGRFGKAGRISTIIALSIVGVVLLAIVGGYVWWRGFTQGPAYTLALLVDAARRDDAGTVDTIIDSDQVAQGFIPQIIDKIAGGGVALPPNIQRGQLSTAIPLLIPRVRELVRAEITRGMKGVAEQVGTSLPTPLLAMGISRASEVEEAGDAATLKLKMADRIIEVSMRRNGDNWKIVTVKDDALAGEIAGRLASSLTSPADSQSQPRRRPGR
jgi:hypothetical protein